MNKNNNKGFSLVELIIVIAIMAVLIGVMAPQYIKYVEKSRISTDEQNADAFLSNVQTALTNEEAIKDLTTTSKGTVITWTSEKLSIGDVDGKGTLKKEIQDTLGVNDGDTSKKIQSTKYKSSTYEVSIKYVDNTGFRAFGGWTK
jgi:type IV pilus assembly protein PilA